MGQIKDLPSRLNSTEDLTADNLREMLDSVMANLRSLDDRVAAVEANVVSLDDRISALE